MATTRINTVGGGSIRCQGTTEEIRKALEAAEANGERYFCCGNQCIRIDQIITIIQELVVDPGAGGGGGGPTIINPGVVILTTGQPSEARAGIPPEPPS